MKPLPLILSALSLLVFSLDALAETRLVAEGVKTCRSAYDLAARHGIDMPIINEMYRILYENESPRDAIQRLMSRALKPETPGAVSASS